ncbi:MAG: carbohydrate ABC transporter permease [Treponema sp.]|jgi:putative aldouronate transport system permease protein|nr:carbohydrate ABC transporter permease [Treponema sp.]
MANKTITGNVWISDLIIYLVLTILAVIFLLPFWMVAVTSVISESERLSRGLLLLYPRKLDFSAYQVILAKNSQIVSAYGVTILRTVVGTLCNLLVTSGLAYGLAKKTLPFRKPITMAIFFTSIFYPGLIPVYLTIKYTGLYDTFLAFIVPNLVVAWWMLILRNFFMQIPEEIEEAATIDGASPPLILFRIILPLSLPSLATIGMFYAVWHWNSWFDGMIYVSKMSLQPAQVVLRNIISASMIENLDPTASEVPPPLEAVKAAAIMVTTIPILVVYPFIQRYFVKGALVGSVKG